MIVIKTEQEIERMRAAGRLAALAHERMREAIRPGIRTQDLDDLFVEFLKEHGASASFLGYNGFPKSICVSVNEEVVHGIPGDRRLNEGDIVSVDLGVIVDSYHGDAAWTYPVGEIDEEARHLLEVGEASLMEAIRQIRPGNRLGDVSHAVQRCAEAAGLSVVRDFVGHGIGRAMHEPPQIPNFGPPGRGPILRPGMTLAVEPMVNLGTHEVEVLEDQWTVVTKDRRWSAHFEHTILVADGEAEILTSL